MGQVKYNVGRTKDHKVFMRKLQEMLSHHHSIIGDDMPHDGKVYNRSLESKYRVKKEGDKP